MKRIENFRGDTRGAIAIEFAVLGPLFVLMIVGFVYFASLALTTLRLNSAVAQAAILLGQEDEGAMQKSEADLRDLICTVAALSDCDSRLAIRIEPLNDFGATDAPDGNVADDDAPALRQALKMKILSARYETGDEFSAMSRLLFGAAQQDEINASAMFVQRGG
jgi:Flp pilus assembly pilin Flp